MGNCCTDPMRLDTLEADPSEHREVRHGVAIESTGAQAEQLSSTVSGDLTRGSHNKRRRKVKKKQWQKPELVVLLRSNAEEAVLTACKHPQFPGGGPQALHESCSPQTGAPCDAIKQS